MSEENNSTKEIGRGIIRKGIGEILMLIEGGKLRADLEETPQRVVNALEEMLDGYETDIGSLFKTFDGEGKDMIVAVKDIEFTSLCEHHLLPFSGVAHVAYLPVDRVRGASKDGQ